MHASAPEREKLKRFQENLQQGQNLAFTVLCVPCSPDSGSVITLDGRDRAHCLQKEIALYN